MSIPTSINISRNGIQMNRATGDVSFLEDRVIALENRPTGGVDNTANIAALESRVVELENRPTGGTGGSGINFDNDAVSNIANYRYTTDLNYTTYTVYNNTYKASLAEMGQVNGAPYSNYYFTKYRNVVPFKYSGKVYTATPAHAYHTTPPVVNPMQDLRYENIVPRSNYNLYEMEAILRTPGKQLSNSSDSSMMTNISEQGFGYGSDVWGYKNIDVELTGTNGSFITTEDLYTIMGTSVGVCLVKTKNFGRGGIASIENEPIQFINFSNPLSWTDAKTYDVTNLVLKLPSLVDSPLMTDEHYLNIFKEDALMQLELKSIDGITLESHQLVPVQCIDTATIGVDGEGNRILSVRIKTTYNIKAGYHFHNVYLADKGGMKMVHTDVHADTTRDLYAYMIKEQDNEIYAVNLLPTLTGGQAIITDEYSSKYESGTPFVIEDDSTKIVSPGYLRGGHNIAMCEKTRTMYVTGNGLAVRYKRVSDSSDRGHDGSYAFDLTDPSTPVPKMLIMDGNPKYTHDSVTVVYNETEQKELLGIPEANVTPGNLVMYFDCTGGSYDILDITDPYNPVRNDSINIFDSGYYHQAWNSTDKRYFFISDEILTGRIDNIGRIPVIRMHWSGETGMLKLKHVQDLHTNLPTRVHNMYTVSNIDRFAPKWKNDQFEDWIYVALYSAGIGVISVKYDTETTVDDYDGDTEAFAMRDEPFVYKKMCLCKTNITPTHNDFEGAWSVYPFFEPGTVASKTPFAGSDISANGVFLMRYQEGITNYDSRSPEFAGDVIRKLHPTGTGTGTSASETTEETGSKNAIFSRIGGYLSTGSGLGLRLKNGETAGVRLTTNGIFTDHDVILSRVIDLPVAIDEIDIPELATSVNQGDTLYALCGNTILPAQVMKPMSSEYYEYLLGYKSVTGPAKLLNSRCGEITVSGLNVNPGDSGNPVLNADGKLVGFINDVDTCGGSVGITNISSLLNYIVDGRPDLGFQDSMITGVEGIYNNRRDGITTDDPTKLSVIAINEAGGPNQGKMYFPIDASAVRFMIMNVANSGYLPQDDGSVPELYDNKVNLQIGSNNETLYSYAKKGDGVALLKTYIIKFNASDEDFQKLTVTEEFAGRSQNGGPKVVYLKDRTADRRQPSDSATTRYAEVYPVAAASTDPSELYISGLGYINPLPGSILDSEQGVAITVLDLQTDQEAPTPSWYFSADAAVYPFNTQADNFESPTATSKTAGGLDTLTAYGGVSVETPLKVQGLGSIQNVNVLSRSAGIPIDSVRNYNGMQYLGIDLKYTLTENSPYYVDGQFLPTIITSIDDAPVDKDTALPIMRSVIYKPNTSVKIGFKKLTTPPTEINVMVPVKPAREAISWL